MATEIGSLYYDIDAKDDKLLRMLDKSDGSIRGFASRASSSFGSIADGIQSVVTKLAVLAVGTGFGAAKFVNLANELQVSQQSMEVLIGSSEKAKKVFGELYNYTLGKPIAFPSAAAAAKTLVGYGIEADKVMGSMKDLGAISMATGADIEKLALAYGQVNARGKLMGQEVLQLVDQSVPVVKILAKHFNKSLTQMSEDMHGGKVSAQDFNAAIHEYVNGLDISKFSNSFKNRMISLQGTIRSVGLELLGVRIDPELGMVVEPGGLFDRLSNLLPKIAEALKQIKDPLKNAIGWLLDNGDLVKSIVLAIAAAFVTAKLAAIGFAAVAFLSSPMNLFALAVTAVVAGLTFLQSRFGTLTTIWKAIGPLLTNIRNIFTETGTIVLSILRPAIESIIASFKRTWQSLQPLWQQIQGPVISALKLLGLLLIGPVIAAIVGTAYAIAALVAAGAKVISWFASLNDWLIRVYASLDRFTQKIGFLNGPANLLKSVVEGLSSALGLTSGATDRATSAAERQKTAHDRLRQSLEDVKNSTNQLKDAQYNLEGSNLAVERAQKSYNDAVSQYGPDSLEAREALHQLKGAQDEQKNASDQAKNATDQHKNAMMGLADQRGQIDTLSQTAGVTMHSGSAFDWAKERLDQFIIGLASIGSRALSAIGDLSGTLWSAGGQLIGGLINGIKNQIGNLTSAARDAANAAVSAVKNFLHIRSPSLVFQGIGENMAQGMILGMQRNVPAVAVAASGMAAGSVAASYSTSINIGQIGSQGDADYLLRKIDRNQQLAAKGVSPR